MRYEKLKKQFDLDHDLVQAFARTLKGAGINLINLDGTPYELDAHEIDYLKNMTSQKLSLKKKYQIG